MLAVCEASPPPRPASTTQGAEGAVVSQVRVQFRKPFGFVTHQQFVTRVYILSLRTTCANEHVGSPWSIHHPMPKELISRYGLCVKRSRRTFVPISQHTPTGVYTLPVEFAQLCLSATREVVARRVHTSTGSATIGRVDTPAIFVIVRVVIRHPSRCLRHDYTSPCKRRNSCNATSTDSPAFTRSQVNGVTLPSNKASMSSRVEMVRR